MLSARIECISYVSIQIYVKIVCRTLEKSSGFVDSRLRGFEYLDLGGFGCSGSGSHDEGEDEREFVVVGAFSFGVLFGLVNGRAAAVATAVSFLEESAGRGSP